MRYVNSTLALRLLNICLLCWLLSQLGTLFDQFSHWSQFLESRRQQSLNDQQIPALLDASPLYSPLPAGSLEFEAIRLNELFARPQHKCADRRVVGRKKDSFFVCFDPELVGEERRIKNALSVSGQKTVPAAHLSLELALNASTWTLLVPERNQLVETLQTDVFLQFMSELEDQGHFPRDRLANTLEGVGQTFELAKLDLDSELLADTQRGTEARLELLQWILKRLQTRQLLLVIRPGIDATASKDEEGKVLLSWYRFFYAIFFRWNFSLLGVRSNGRCGQALQRFDFRHCEWRASFVRFVDLWEAQELPAYGIGSPLEEKLRLLRYLLSSNDGNRSSAASSNCAKNGRGEQGLLPRGICSADQQPSSFDLLIYFRYRELDAGSLWEMEDLLDRTEKMAMFFCLEDPTALGNTTLAERSDQVISLVSAGISYRANQSTSMPMTSGAVCPLRPFDDLLRSVPLLPFRRNALLLDLDGGEWDVLGLITASREICENWLRSFEQIVLRIRLWAMEESENWRRFQLWLLRLEECQFDKAHGANWQQQESTFLVVYKRKRIVAPPADLGRR